MKHITNFFKFILQIICNSVLIICLVMDIIGIAIIVYTDINITYTHLLIIFGIGLLISCYKIYTNNLPEINICAFLLKKYPYKTKSAGDNNIDIMVNFNLLLSNNGNITGIVESIKVDLIKFCKIKDKYVTDKIGVEFTEYFISDEEIFTPLEFMKHKKETAFPIILGPKQMVNKILILYITIYENSVEEYLKTINWIEDLEFLVTVNTKYNNEDRILKYNLKVNKQEIEQFRIKHLQSEKEILEELGINNE